MIKKIIFIGLLGVGSITANAADLDFNAVDSKKIDKAPEFTEVIQLIPKEEKMQFLAAKIQYLKEDIAKWKQKELELMKIKTEYEDAYKENELKIAQYNKEITELKEKIAIVDAKEKEEELKKVTEEVKNNHQITLKENNEKIDRYNKIIDQVKEDIALTSESILEKSEEIEVGQKLIDDKSSEDEVVVFSLPDGKKIKLLKHTVFPGESLSNIMKRTFPKGHVYKYSEIEFRINTVIHLNRDLKNKDQIRSGQVIYIPFFKQ